MKASAPNNNEAEVADPAVSRLWRRDATTARLQKLLALAAVAAAGLFLALVYLPGRTVLADLDRRIDDRADELDSGVARAARLPQIVAAADELERSLREFKTLPNEAQLSDFVGAVTELAGRLQLRDFNLDPGEPVVDGSLSRLPVRLSFAGDFVNAFDFLRVVEQLPRPLRVRELSVRPLAARSGRAVVRGEVEATMTINLYYRTPANGG